MVITCSKDSQSRIACSMGIVRAKYAFDRFHPWCLVQIRQSNWLFGGEETRAWRKVQHEGRRSGVCHPCVVLISRCTRYLIMHIQSNLHIEFRASPSDMQAGAVQKSVSGMLEPAWGSMLLQIWEIITLALASCPILHHLGLRASFGESFSEESCTVKLSRKTLHMQVQYRVHTIRVS